MDLEQTIQLEIAPRISPKLIASIKILALSSQDLAQTIAQEARENPALDVDEIAQCQTCGERLQDGACPNCATPTDAPQDTTERAEWDFDDLFSPTAQRAPAAAGDEYDPFARVFSEETLVDHLLYGLDATIELEDHDLAIYLVGSLDEHGYLSCEIEEAALALGVSVGRAERVLSALQNLEPAGIGARDVQECMLIQLRALAELGIRDPHAAGIITDHFRELAERRWQDIATSLGTSTTAIRESAKFIKDYLNPYPANGFRPAGSRPSRNYKPDVAIRRVVSGGQVRFEIEVLEAGRFSLRVDSTYRDLTEDLKHATVSLSEEDRSHIKDHVARARFFIDCVRQRWETLRQITERLVEYQRDFLLYGVRHLRHLTRSELADLVGLHESTISRATADKFVLLPNGRSIPFHDFFDASLSIKDTMKEFIRSEAEEGPLSDQQIAEKLARRHLHVARRTVAKYRDALGILPSRYR
mgnify:CR=1 FL=1